MTNGRNDKMNQSGYTDRDGWTTRDRDDLAISERSGLLTSTAHLQMESNTRCVQDRIVLEDDPQLRTPGSVPNMWR
jgi:hypothetical protein